MTKLYQTLIQKTTNKNFCTVVKEQCFQPKTSKIAKVLHPKRIASLFSSKPRNLVYIKHVLQHKCNMFTATSFFHIVIMCRRLCYNIRSDTQLVHLTSCLDNEKNYISDTLKTFHIHFILVTFLCTFNDISIQMMKKLTFSSKS